MDDVDRFESRCSSAEQHGFWPLIGDLTTDPASRIRSQISLESALW
jgi:hypothetical protein